MYSRPRPLQSLSKHAPVPELTELRKIWLLRGEASFAIHHYDLPEIYPRTYEIIESKIAQTPSERWSCALAGTPNQNARFLLKREDCYQTDKARDDLCTSMTLVKWLLQNQWERSKRIKGSSGHDWRRDCDDTSCLPADWLGNCSILWIHRDSLYSFVAGKSSVDSANFVLIKSLHIGVRSHISCLTSFAMGRDMQM